MIKFKYKTTFSSASLFRITFNTAFIGTDNKIAIDRWQISPESLQKDFEKFGEKFRCELRFKDYCEAGCRSHKTQLDKLCQNCKSIMTDELDHWLEATRILKQHRKPTLEEGRYLIKGSE